MSVSILLGFTWDAERTDPMPGGLQCLFWPARTKLIMCAADSYKHSMLQAPTHSTNARCLFDCISATVYRSPYCHTGFERQRTCSYFCAFFTFFLTQIFTSFHICASLFTAFFCSLGFVTWRKIGVKNIQGSCPPALFNVTL